MEQMAQAFGGLIKGRYPHVTIRHTQPIATRACFNTRVLDKTLTEPQRYAARKQLSVLALQKMLGAESWAKFKTTFGDKLDDAAEAGLLAIYAHNVPVARRRVSARTATTEVKKQTLTVPFGGEIVKLTEAEREPILERARSMAVTKKRKRAASPKVDKKKPKASKA